MRDDKDAIASDMVDEPTVIHDISAFLEQNAGPSFSRPVERNTPLLNSSLDSFTILQLMMFLSEKYQFELGEEDFVEEHFGTVAALARRVVAKRENS